MYSLHDYIHFFHSRIFPVGCAPGVTPPFQRTLQIWNRYLFTNIFSTLEFSSEREGAGFGGEERCVLDFTFYHSFPQFYTVFQVCMVLEFLLQKYFAPQTTGKCYSNNSSCINREVLDIGELLLSNDCSWEKIIFSEEKYSVHDAEYFHTFKIVICRLIMQYQVAGLLYNRRKVFTERK